MSRAGRGGGRGGFGGRNTFGSNNLPPMGLTFADIQAISREQSAIYPPLEPLPALTEYSEEERRICDLQRRFAARLRRSAYYVTQANKSTARTICGQVSSCSCHTAQARAKRSSSAFLPSRGI
ncbi:hypothetical protein DFH94DRAFT_303502 [Russula ochroleuca]|uniref:Uncharacterized protein n=1 Tax=Russula ochroleuca TaxID=152965 RepID=A0A9P5N0C5_9AGAM|nr:hypothetical protein DFH94DRAFT_303502 [Russula ochroleuca]